ncbi:2'-5' RNA ligase [Halorubrum alkaliphilum]|uniref:2'-5' RNA ligase n=1 Tax=Halorubrum alkaliphilum TaxID=261290 RepID=A0A8T4GGN2_9EURY|nr:2'-5' RNA ligase family protein [Halorubrum alkaliphilum]MBP1922601.1 2'-5' RNA ligase [Halorubrum alkaliphilum]
MFSVNVPLPPAIDRLATELQPKLSGFDRIRDRHTLVCKRVGVEDVGKSDRYTRGTDDRAREEALGRLRETIRPVLADTDPFRASVTGIDAFGEEDDAFGNDGAVVAYLAVESRELVRLHRRLCRLIDPVDEIEGDGYVPHVTVARGGDPSRKTMERLLNTDIDPVTWRVHALDLYDAEFREVAETVGLQA